MNKPYYLMNGKNGKGYAVNLLVDGVKTKEFCDISLLDLKTLEIKKNEAANTLSEYNGALFNEFYDVQYLFNKNEFKGFIPMFKYDNEKTRKIEENFRNFSEERMFNFKNDKSLRLNEGEQLEKYIQEILYDILTKEQSKLLSFDSIMSAYLKEILLQRYSIYKNQGTRQFLKDKNSKIKHQLSNYTELRNLTIEYLLWKQGKEFNYRRYIRARENYDNYLDKSMLIDSNKEPVEEYRQMTFEDYINNPKLLTKQK